MREDLSNYLMVIVRSRDSCRDLSAYLDFIDLPIMWCGFLSFKARANARADLSHGEYVFKRLTRLMDI
jgi:hypothetical protein